jgi:AAA15 family ATPase/GTPase
MYNFSHINIHQFRGFSNFNLENLGRINLLVGMNNAGKTSLLEAVSLYCRALDSMEWFATASRRGMRQPFAPPVIESLKWLFPQNREKSEILMKAQGRFQVREVRATFEELISSEVSMRMETDFENEELIHGAEIKVIRKKQQQTETQAIDEETFRLWEKRRFMRTKKTLIEPVLPVSTIMPFSHRLEPIQIKQLTEAKKKDTVEHVLNLIRRIDPKIEDLEILSSDGTQSSLYIRQTGMGLAPLNIFGEGLQRSLAIALSLSSVQNGILLIDELEAGIHTSILQAVFSWLMAACRDYNVQLIATTHSLEALDALLASIPNDSDEIVAYRLGAEGQIKRFGGNLLYRLRYERGLDVR